MQYVFYLIHYHRITNVQVFWLGGGSCSMKLVPKRMLNLFCKKMMTVVLMLFFFVFLIILIFERKIVGA